MSIVTRFAPSPTGYLHLGHAASALFAWRLAKAAGGRFLLRLEDIDPTRCRPEFAAAIQQDLAWLGAHWDGPADQPGGAPVDKAENGSVRMQSAHMAQYQSVLDRLDGLGLLYPCFCTRADILREVADSAAAPHAPDGSLVYPGSCRGLSPDQRAARIASGDRYALRLDMPAALRRVGSGLTFHEANEGIIVCHPQRFGDVILGRKETPASYHLCVTHDDALQGVTLVTRGEDLKPATDLHRLLQVLMGWPEPAYSHHRLLRDPSGRRLAKRDRDITLRDLRAAGLTPAEVIARADL